MIVKGVLEIGMQEYRNLGADRASRLAEEELYAGMQDEIFETIRITSKENPLLDTMTFEGEVAVLPVEELLTLRRIETKYYKLMNLKEETYD